MSSGRRWWRWRAGRAVRAVLPDGERITDAVRLDPAGWWALTDEALYVAVPGDAPRRIPRLDVAGVRSLGHLSMSEVTVTVASGESVTAHVPGPSTFIDTLKAWAAPPTGGRAGS